MRLRFGTALWLFGLAALDFGVAANLAAQANTWTSIGPDGGVVLALAVDPSHHEIAYAGTWGNGVFKTTDSGASWRATGPLIVSPSYQQYSITVLCVDPSKPSTVWAGTYYGVFESDDSGATWNFRGGLDSSPIWLLQVVPGTPTRVYAGTNSSHLYRSDDSGAFWTDQKLPISTYGVPVTMAVDPRNRDVIYVGSYEDETFKSTSAGDAWTTIDIYSAYSIALDPTAPDTVYFGCYAGGVFKSLDGGAHAAKASAGLDSNFILAVAADPSGDVCAATDGSGIFASIDGAANWTAKNAGLPSGFLETLAIDPVDPSILYAGMNGAGVFQSTDDGASWRSRNTGLAAATVVQVATHLVDPSTVFSTLAGVGVASTNNDGSTWQVGTTGPAFPDFRDFSIDPSDPATLYAAHTRALLKSVDGGTNWADRTPPEINRLFAVAVAPTSSQVVYASGSRHRGVSHSSERRRRGALDRRRRTDPGQAAISQIVVSPADPLIALGRTGSAVGRTIDGGTTWQFPVLPFLYYTPISNIAFDPVDPLVVYLSAYGLYRARMEETPGRRRRSRAISRAPRSSSSIPQNTAFSTRSIRMRSSARASTPVGAGTRSGAAFPGSSLSR